MRITIHWHSPLRDIADRVTGGKDGQLFLANEAKRLMDPYVPADNLVLAQNVRTYVESGQGIVEYLSPYAHYQFTGLIYVDPKTGAAGFWIRGIGWRSRKGVAKIPTKRKLKYSKFRHPLATSRWDKAMVSARKGDLVRAYQSYLNGGIW